MTTTDKFGVALTKCFYCGKNTDLVMNTRLGYRTAEKVKELHGKVCSLQPCATCEGYMRRGIIILTMDEAKSEKGWQKEPIPNPYRTGGFFVVREGVLERMVNNPSIVAWANKSRWIFMQEEVARKTGLYSTTPTQPAE